MDKAADIAAAFDRLDRLLAVAQDAGPSLALLLAVGRQKGIPQQKLHRSLQINETVARWALRLDPDAAADRDEIPDVGALLIEWARRSAS